MFSPYHGQERDIQRTTVFITAVTTVLVLCRLCLVWKNNKEFFLEDIFVVVADGCLIMFAAVVFVATTYGFGTHLVDIQGSGGDFRKAMKFFWLAQMFYTLCIGFVKLSFLALYHRLFGRNSPTFRLCCLCLGTICLIWMTAYIFIALFQCTPIHRTWNRNTPGTCINFAIHRWSHAATNLATDLAILALPIRPIITLQMSWATRFGLLLVCLVGGFVCIITILRMRTLPTTLATTDPTWASAPTFLWSFIESGAAVICLCLISFHGSVRAFWMWLRNAGRGTWNRTCQERSSAYGQGSGADRRKDVSGNTSDPYYELNTGDGGGTSGILIASDDATSTNGSEAGIMDDIRRTTRFDVKFS